MKNIIISCLFLTACGFSSRNNELIGQVKKVQNLTPLICDDRFDADISLGVMRGGVGSMSSQDQWVYVPNKSDQEILTKANASGELVKIIYDDKRFSWCKPTFIVVKAEIITTQEK